MSGPSENANGAKAGCDIGGGGAGGGGDGEGGGGNGGDGDGVSGTRGAIVTGIAAPGTSAGYVMTSAGVGAAWDGYSAQSHHARFSNTAHASRAGYDLTAVRWQGRRAPGAPMGASRLRLTELAGAIKGAGAAAQPQRHP